MIVEPMNWNGSPRSGTIVDAGGQFHTCSSKSAARNWRSLSERRDCPDGRGRRARRRLEEPLGFLGGKSLKPRAAPFRINFDQGCREVGIRESAGGDRDHVRSALDLVKDGDAACRAEIEACPITVVRAAGEASALARYLDLIAGIGRVPGEGTAGPAFAVEAVANRDPDRIPCGPNAQHSARAKGGSCRHSIPIIISHKRKGRHRSAALQSRQRPPPTRRYKPRCRQTPSTGRWPAW